MKKALGEAKTTVTYDEAFEQGHSVGYEEGTVEAYALAKKEVYEQLKKATDEVAVELEKIAQTFDPAGMQEAEVKD